MINGVIVLCRPFGILCQWPWVFSITFQWTHVASMMNSSHFVLRLPSFQLRRLCGVQRRLNAAELNVPPLGKPIFIILRAYVL